MNKNIMMVGIVVLVLLVGGGILMSQQSKTTPADTNTAPTQAAQTQTTPSEAVDGAMMAGEVRTIEIEAGSFYYNPKEIKVKKGEKVKIILTAKDMMHNFTIDELNVASDTVSAGKSTTFEFTADKAGTFEYYCSIGQHRQRGQVGTLIVE